MVGARSEWGEGWSWGDNKVDMGWHRSKSRVGLREKIGFIVELKAERAMTGEKGKESDITTVCQVPSRTFGGHSRRPCSSFWYFVAQFIWSTYYVLKVSKWNSKVWSRSKQIFMLSLKLSLPRKCRWKENFDDNTWHSNRGRLGYELCGYIFMSLASGERGQMVSPVPRQVITFHVWSVLCYCVCRMCQKVFRQPKDFAGDSLLRHHQQHQHHYHHHLSVQNWTHLHGKSPSRRSLYLKNSRAAAWT